MGEPRRAMHQRFKHFGSRLRWWRERRGLSQLDLAGAAETTQRHLSFLESGRAGPSHEMILRLAATLDLPLRQQNALLLAAGYAPAWRESELSVERACLLLTPLLGATHQIASRLPNGNVASEGAATARRPNTSLPRGSGAYGDRSGETIGSAPYRH